ncbi:patatin-like phospholipase family protein [Paraburkholderia sp. BR10872]|uniref:patatin-like phospholipase family protein n=1 Tax=Paraburkholderia sp. BR10872 TaxID=3236989 RepID=UPI0034D2FCA6
MRPIRVALSGSGTKAPAHVGALQAISDAGFSPIEMCGTSGGALVSALYSCGMSLADLRELAMTMDWAPLMSGSLMSIITGKGYSSGNALLQWLQKQTAGKTFDDIDMELTIVSSDISSEVPYLFSKKLTPKTPIALAGRASASIPIYFVPVVIDGKVLVDGGLVSNCPVDELTEDGVPRIGIDLAGMNSPLSPGEDGITKIAPHLIDLMVQSTEDAHIAIGKMTGAIVAQVPCGYASPLDKSLNPVLRNRLYTDGYATTKAALAQFAGVTV